jgi:cation diffusion facilitator CzcD-associated flavoprotein CzcO
VRVAIIGSGFAGICMAIALKGAGISDFVVLEKHPSQLGGTWRDNTYPGCACDVPSYFYSYSFEPNPGWSRMFAPAGEIWAYLRRCVEKYGIGPHLRFGAEVTGARFDAERGSWAVEVNAAETLSAQVLVAGAGALHVPNIPPLPGLESFAGTTFHSARWDHEHDLTGRRVAVIGTGASAVQFVPQIASTVQHLDVYQRTAAWVTPKPDRRIGPSEQRLHARFPSGQRVIRNLVYWALEARGAGFTIHPALMKGLERQARRHLEAQVSDSVLRQKLSPGYPIGCKRILLSDDYYPALARDNVELVTEPIARVEAGGIRTGDGVRRDVDTIIFGTGFEVSANLTAMKIVGRTGMELSAAWSREGAGAYLGVSVTGFPNLFLLVGPNTGLAHSSMVFMIESQVRYVMRALDLLDRSGARFLDVRRDAQRRFVDGVQSRLAGSVWQSGCTSWYLDASGRNVTIWPHSTGKYWWRTRRLRPGDYDLAGQVSG